jgi:long-chain fatty acid transport protein
MVTDYNSTWVGRYYNSKSDVKTYNATPMIGWQPSPKFTIAAGMQIQYIKGTLGKAIDFGLIGALHSLPGSIPGHQDGSVMLKAQDWGFGYVVGALWKPMPELSVGLSYRSEIDNTLKGTETFTLDSAGIGAFLNAHSPVAPFTNSKAAAPMKNPAVATLGVRWQATPDLAVMVGADWYMWSSFKALVASSTTNPATPVDTTTMNWKNSLSGSLGIEYKLCQDLKVRLGTAYDETPTVNDFRTPGIPDGSRYWLSAGVGYRLTDNIDLDISVARLMAQKAKIHLVATPTNENAARGTLDGVVQMAVTLVGFEFSYHL